MINIWSGKLLTEVKFGHVIIVGGLVKPCPVKISFDFAENSNATYKQTDNIILHLSARFNEKQIIRSSHFPNVGWSDEQISDNLIGKALKNPLKAGKPFTIRLTVLQAIFQVHINDELYCTYDHNRPLNEIKYVRVKHDFERVTQFDHRLLFPTIFPIQFEHLDSFYVFSSDVPSPMEIGTTIAISGIVAGNKNGQFGIDLFNNNSLQIIMRFMVDFGQKLIVRTAQRTDMKFYDEDEEKIAPNFPFKRGESFKLGIIVTRESFQFYVNGELFTYFNHRNGINELATIKCWALQNGTATGGSTELFITNIHYNDGPMNLNKFTSLTE